MSEPSVYRERRRRLASSVGRSVLLQGHADVLDVASGRYRFRQDSNFLYFTGVELPGASVLLQSDGHSTLFLPTPSSDDFLWHGETPGPEAVGAGAGVDRVAPSSDLPAGDFLTLPTLDPRLGAGPASKELVEAVIELRLGRDEAELAAMRRAVAVTREAHLAAMEATRPGVTDTELEALVDGIFALHGMRPAYGSIVTPRGEILHGRAAGLTLQADQLLLLDAGAEEPSGYASDVTRTWPVSGAFDDRQRAIYQAVLESQEAAIARCRAGTRYREVHLAAARVLTEHLVELGLLRGEVDGLLEQGAHAVFFPHGVGHLIGLDVHDMEMMGEQVGYPAGRQRSEQFGLAFLRLDRDLRPGMVVTVEPGIYLAPGLLGDPGLRERLGDSVDWERARSWLPFGGIRIEDDVLVTEGDPEILSARIPRSVEEVEERVGSGPSPRERLLAL